MLKNGIISLNNSIYGYYSRTGVSEDVVLVDIAVFSDYSIIMQSRAVVNGNIVYFEDVYKIGDDGTIITLIKSEFSWE